MPDGRLISIPAKNRKRRVILAWLAEHFRPAQRYPESTVNEVLGRYHSDYAGLRRYLVDEELMQGRHPPLLASLRAEAGRRDSRRQANVI